MSELTSKEGNGELKMAPPSGQMQENEELVSGPLLRTLILESYCTNRLRIQMDSK